MDRKEFTRRLDGPFVSAARGALYCHGRRDPPAYRPRHRVACGGDLSGRGDPGGPGLPSVGLIAEPARTFTARWPLVGKMGIIGPARRERRNGLPEPGAERPPHPAARFTALVTRRPWPAAAPAGPAGPASKMGVCAIGPWDSRDCWCRSSGSAATTSAAASTWTGRARWWTRPSTPGSPCSTRRTHTVAAVARSVPWARSSARGATRSCWPRSSVTRTRTWDTGQPPARRAVAATSDLGGGSERALGEILGSRRDQVVLATKFGHQNADMGYGPAAGAKGGRGYIRSRRWLGACPGRDPRLAARPGRAGHEVRSPERGHGIRASRRREGRSRLHPISAVARSVPWARSSARGATRSCWPRSSVTRTRTWDTGQPPARRAVAATSDLGGGSERALGEILGSRRDQVVLATKFGHQNADMGYGPAAGAKGGRGYI